jgi:hypothetical protein
MTETSLTGLLCQHLRYSLWANYRTANDIFITGTDKTSRDKTKKEIVMLARMD